jgi:hypothetical protein
MAALVLVMLQGRVGKGMILLWLAQRTGFMLSAIASPDTAFGKVALSLTGKRLAIISFVMVFLHT